VTTSDVLGLLFDNYTHDHIALAVLCNSEFMFMIMHGNTY